MVPDGWLEPGLVLLGRAPSRVEELVREVAKALGDVTGEPVDRVAGAFTESIRGEGYSLGRGAAIPHTEVESLSRTRVCLVTLTHPLAVASIDGRPVDVFFFILSRPDPQSHLLLLAHLARLAQSRTLLDGLRRAHDVEDALALIAAAERRHTFAAAPAAARAPVVAAPVVTETLVVISLSGEQAVDALLIELVDLGLPDACILEAQSLREATAREVPLFTGFRDLFGDPGGRRILFLEAPASRTEDIIATVRAVCEEHGTRDARVSVLPLHARWSASIPSARAAPGGD
ncbi:MAG: PTS sugar transporter subunit IIA [Polyangiaceae bacterium]|nr:PTS sugar transporter subunit IIA [Polyangiaceae bacterium]